MFLMQPTHSQRTKRLYSRALLLSALLLYSHITTTSRPQCTYLFPLLREHIITAFNFFHDILLRLTIPNVVITKSNADQAALGRYRLSHDH